MGRAYGMFPDTGTAEDVATCGIPFYVCDAVVVCCVHVLQVGGEIFVAFRLLAFEIEVPEVEVETLLGVDSSYDDEASSGRPVDGVAVLLLDRLDVLEVSDASAFDLFRAEERDCSFRWDGCCHDHFCGGDENEAVAFGLPLEVDNGVFD